MRVLAATVLSNPRARFLITAGCWSAALLLGLRSPAGERAIVAPFAALHEALAAGLGGSPVRVDLSCSGSDVIALSIAAILAYPVPWRRRLAGVGLAAIWLASLNLIRIVTLVNTAGTPLFTPLHLYIWPAILIAAAALYVLVWIWMSDSAPPTDAATARWRALITATALLVVAYAAIAPWAMASAALERAAIMVATATAALLHGCGVAATVGASTLVVRTQAFVITPECIITPLMPVWLAWALVWPRRRAARVAALAGFLPLFATLSVLRLVTIALPAIVVPPLYVTHSFYQLLVGVLLVIGAARLGTATPALRARRSAVAIAAAIGVALVGGRAYTALVNAAVSAVRAGAPHALAAAPVPADAQGVLAIMPSYALALLWGLAIAGFGRSALVPLAAAMPAGVVLLAAALAIAGELTAHLAAPAPVAAIRAASIGIPLTLFAAALYLKPGARRALASDESPRVALGRAARG